MGAHRCIVAARRTSDRKSCRAFSSPLPLNRLRLPPAGRPFLGPSGRSSLEIEAVPDGSQVGAGQWWPLYALPPRCIGGPRTGPRCDRDLPGSRRAGMGWREEPTCPLTSLLRFFPCATCHCRFHVSVAVIVDIGISPDDR